MPKTKEERQATQQAVDESWEQVVPGTALALGDPPRQLGRPLTMEVISLAWTSAPMIRHLFSRSVSPEQAAAIMLAGYELGFNLTAAPRFIDMLPDGPAVNGQGVMALAHASGLVEITVQDHEDAQGIPTGCTVTMKRRDSGFVYTTTFTAADAQQAQLASKDNYKKYAANMYRWRAVGNCGAVAIPDLLGGLKLNIELDQSAEPPHVTVMAPGQPPIDVDPATGEIITEAQATISDTPPSQQPLDANGFAPGGQELPL